MAKGRKRKTGKRTPSGSLSRAGKPRGPSIVQPSDWVANQRRLYGEHYSTAIGRAFAVGLLGEGNAAKDRLPAALRFASLYRRALGGDRYRCALSDAPRGSDGIEATQRDADDQEWMLVNMGRMDRTGGRPFFDQLISRSYTDVGPAWLDSLLHDAKRDRRDMMVMNAAIAAIDALGPVDRGCRIEREWAA